MSDQPREDMNIPKWFLGLMGAILIPVATFIGYMFMEVTTLKTEISTLQDQRIEMRASIKSQSDASNEATKELTKEIVGLRLDIERLVVANPSRSLEIMSERLDQQNRNIEELRKEVSTIKNELTKKP